MYKDLINRIERAVSFNFADANAAPSPLEW